MAAQPAAERVVQRPAAARVRRSAAVACKESKCELTRSHLSRLLLLAKFIRYLWREYLSMLPCPWSGRLKHFANPRFLVMVKFCAHRCILKNANRPLSVVGCLVLISYCCTAPPTANSSGRRLRGKSGAGFNHGRRCANLCEHARRRRLGRALNWHPWRPCRRALTSANSSKIEAARRRCRWRLLSTLRLQFTQSARWIEGSDPELKQQYVLVTAHYDHVGYGKASNSYGPLGQIHNGADDNASGDAAS